MAFCLCFLLFGLIFAVLKEKAAVLISGFNFKSKEERKLYDTKQMSIDQRNAFFIWPYLAILAFAVWLIVFFKDVHFDDEKAFGKYKLK